MFIQQWILWAYYQAQSILSIMDLLVKMHKHKSIASGGWYFVANFLAIGNLCTLVIYICM